MSRLLTQPVWAGVVVKLADGTTFAFELDSSRHPLKSEIVVEPDLADVSSFGEMPASRFIPKDTSRVRIVLEGTGRHSARFAGMADDVPTGPRAIEGP